MNFHHRWISLDGVLMTAIDVQAYKRERWAWKIRHRLIRLITFWTIAAAFALPTLTQSYA